MSEDLDKFIEKLRVDHAALVKAQTKLHQEAEVAWAKHEAATLKLTEFRSAYGGYLKLADAGSLVVPKDASPAP